jgi:translation elongation factor EF-G
VRDDLIARGAVISDAELAPPIAVVRGTASLAKLLGYPQQLAALTDGTAREVMWLSHYAPLP